MKKQRDEKRDQALERRKREKQRRRQENMLVNAWDSPSLDEAANKKSEDS